jgi:pSer/pThr/pTyr-binding forkhead associated (FHA) protein
MEARPCPFCEGTHPITAERCPVTFQLLPRQLPPPPPPPPSPTTARLALKLTGDRVLRLEVGSTVVMGRDPASPVADLCRGNVSRKHAEITARDERTVVLVDRDSLNRTRVNGRELEHGKERQLLRGDVVELAYDEPLRFEVVEANGQPVDS